MRFAANRMLPVYPPLTLTPIVSAFESLTTFSTKACASLRDIMSFGESALPLPNKLLGALMTFFPY